MRRTLAIIRSTSLTTIKPRTFNRGKKLSRAMKKYLATTYQPFFSALYIVIFDIMQHTTDIRFSLIQLYSYRNASPGVVNIFFWTTAKVLFSGCLLPLPLTIRRGNLGTRRSAFMLEWRASCLSGFHFKRFVNDVCGFWRDGGEPFWGLQSHNRHTQGQDTLTNSSGLPRVALKSKSWFEGGRGILNE